MSQVFLSIIVAGVMLLVTAFALGTPSIKSADVAPEETTLLRLVHHAAPKHIHHTAAPSLKK
jgi:hypothetical protein